MMKTKNKLTWVLSTLLIITMVAVVLFKNASNDKLDNEATLVAALPLTGNLAFLGEPGKVALEIAMQDAKDAGIPFEVKFVDTQASPKEMATVFRKESSVNKNEFFLVTLSGTGLVAKEINKIDRNLIMSVAIHPEIPSSDQPIARYCVSASEEGNQLAERLSNSPGSLAMIVSRDAATTNELQEIIFPHLKEKGKSIDWIEWFDVGQKDFKNLTERFSQKTVKNVIILGYGSDFPKILEALAITRKHNKLMIYGGIGFVELVKIPVGFRPSQFKFLAPTFSLHEERGESSNFKEKYYAKTSKSAPYDAGYTYDAAMHFATLYHQGKKTPEQMILSIRGSSYSGVTGLISWDERGESTTNPVWATYDKESGNIISIMGNK